MAEPPDCFIGYITRVLCLVIGTLFVSCAWAANDVTCRTNDVELLSRDCMTDFYSQLDLLHMTSHRFFTGVDAEIIRSVCSQFHNSVRCLQGVREQCPGPSSESIIDSLIEPHLSLHELCVLPEFYEHYSMHHSCFQRVRSQSDACWTHFRSTTADLVGEITSTTAARSSDRRRQVALHQFCSHLKHLQSCVRNVHAACKKVPPGLSDVLVRASVQLSPRCSSNSDLSGQVTATAIASATYPGGTYRELDDDIVYSTSGAAAMTLSSSSSSWCSWWRLVFVAVTAVYLAAFVDRNSCHLSLSYRS